MSASTAEKSTTSRRRGVAPATAADPDAGAAPADPDQDEASDEAPEPVEGDPVKDLDAILPENGRIVVTTDTGNDIECEVERLKSREFLLLMRILTHGLGAGIRDIRLDTNDRDALAGELLALLMLAVPEAIEEFGAFILAIVSPVDRSKAAEVAVTLQNPDPDVLIDALGIMVEQEADDLVMLGGKAQAWIARIQKGVGRKAAAEKQPTG